MAAPVNWRVKGVDKATRQMASDAAARNEMSVGEWLERAIDDNVGIIPPEDEKPLVSAKMLDSARDNVTDAETGEPDETDIDDQANDPISQPDFTDAGEAEQSPPLSTRTKDRPRRVPNVSPMLITALPRRPSGNLPRVIGGLLLVALMGGAYWLVDQNTKNKLAAETDAVAGRSAIASKSANEEATEEANSGEKQGLRGEVPDVTAHMTPLQLLTASANRGDPRAQHDLGLMYVKGDGIDRDPKLGAQWLEQSATAGMPKAQYHLGLLYQKGLGVSADMKAAYKWYHKAALQGHVRAQYNLGTLFAEGQGTKRDYAEAARWFYRASREGLAEAHYSLGMIHENGMGVKRDQRKAAAHYRSALAAGSAHAAAKLTQLEPALKDLSVSVDRALLESELTLVSPSAGGPPTNSRTLSAAGIKKLQRLLKKLDLSPGPADGVLGAKTMEAIRLYQRFAGLPVDGKPTLDLLVDLRQVVGAMVAETPAASVPAEVR
jgi:TPR repeat protein